MHQFIEDAVKGDYTGIAATQGGMKIPLTEIPRMTHLIHRMLLDPKAWIAVGKTRVWYETPYDMYDLFMDYLWNGLSIEEALNKIK